MGIRPSRQTDDPDTIQWWDISRHVNSMDFYRFERREDGTETDEVIKMRLPTDGGQLQKYLARGFQPSKKALLESRGKPSISVETKLVYGCARAGCDKTFPTKGALQLHESWHQRQTHSDPLPVAQPD